jgi:hypothetical protein
LGEGEGRKGNDGFEIKKKKRENATQLNQNRNCFILATRRVSVLRGENPLKEARFHGNNEKNRQYDFCDSHTYV